VVKDFGLSGLGLWDQRLVQDIEDILADLLELGLDLLAVVSDSGNMLVGTLGLLLLLDRGDNAPGSTSGTDDILVGNRQKVSLIDRKLSTQLFRSSVLTLATNIVRSEYPARRVPWQPLSCM
jgi:hypothetical protein